MELDVSVGIKNLTKDKLMDQFSDACADCYYYYYYYYYYYPLEFFFTSALADGFSLDSSQYSGRSQ